MCLEIASNKCWKWEELIETQDANVKMQISEQF